MPDPLLISVIPITLLSVFALTLAWAMWRTSGR